MDPIPALLDRVDKERIRRNLFHLAHDPIPCRTLVTTLPGHEKCTLYEADDFIADALARSGYEIEREPAQVQAYRRDTSKNEHHQYSAPKDTDPWYTAYNLYGRRRAPSGPTR